MPGGDANEGRTEMTMAELFKQYLEHLFAGKRCEAREMMMAAQDRGICAAKLLRSVVWPAMEQIEQLYRNDRISLALEHMATRINRMVADQLQGLLPRSPKAGRRMIVTCGEGEQEELGSQIIADLFEANGWSVWFVGSGVPDDEILELIGALKADILCVHGAHPKSIPGMRRLIERIREVEPYDQLQILVVGGVFNRAEGLADEIKADLFAKNISGAMKTVMDHPVRIPKPDVPEPGRRRKRRKKTATAKAPASRARSTARAKSKSRTKRRRAPVAV